MVPGSINTQICGFVKCIFFFPVTTWDEVPPSAGTRSIGAERTILPSFRTRLLSLLRQIESSKVFTGSVAPFRTCEVVPKGGRASNTCRQARERGHVAPDNSIGGSVARKCRPDRPKGLGLGVRQAEARTRYWKS